MENRFLACVKPQDEYLNELKALLADVNQFKKNKNICNEIAQTLICYKMADLNLDKLEYKCLNKKSGYIGSQYDDVISINENLLKFNLKNLVALIDCILHEFGHKETELSNKEIKKDEFGTANNKYIPKFYEQFVYLMLHWACDLDLEAASELSVALYAFDQNELQANRYAFLESINLFEACRNKANKRFIDKMIETEKNNYIKLNTIHQTKRNKLLIEEFNCYYKNKLLNFQFEFAKKPSDAPVELSKIYVARMLCPSAEADQELFNHFLKLGNVDACIKIMNAPDFKNTPKNLKDLIALMQKNNVDLSNLTGIDKTAIKRILNMNDNNGQKSGGRTKNVKNETKIEFGLEQ